MQKQLFTTRFLSLTQQIRPKVWPLLFGAAFFCFSKIASADLKIAIVDTGFCPERALTLSKNHRVQAAIDMTDSNSLNCKSISSEELKSGGRFHGQNVLNEFLSFAPSKVSFSITPLVVYNDKGTQTKEAWMKAIAWIKKEKMDLVLTASGFISKDNIVSELPSLWFVPSGRTERFITANTVLFPQSLAPKNNLFVIGDYYDEAQIIYDQSLMYQDKIDYYFPSGKRGFRGTSRAVAEAMGKTIEKCFTIKNPSIDALVLRKCLAQFHKTLKDPILKKEFKTF